MSIKKSIEENNIILTEAAVIEQLRRSEGISLHPRLENATLIYDVNGKRTLRDIYRGYIDVACETDLPINICTPTWRANRERVLGADIGENINGDAVRFLNDMRNEWEDFSSRILIGGLIGCKNDCYKPEEGLQPDKAYSFHSWQIDKL
jgi:S-methylmethionine-dependent homocysteine/selenocysteine methylase